jgi:serine/threonine-protein kinase
MTSTTPLGGVREERRSPAPDRPNRVSHEIPSHLASWQLPPDWRWGSEGVHMEYRHYQEVIDALGRSLSLVSAPDPAHAVWLGAEARRLAHRNHPSIPTTYHYWSVNADSRRGPGYLRRWISAEAEGAKVRRTGHEDVPSVLRLVRAVGSTVASLHDSGMPHGAISPEYVWRAPSGRIWVLGWSWAVARNEIPEGLTPDRRWTPWAPEWGDAWLPSTASDQWQLAALGFFALTGEMPPPNDAPPVRLLRPECPQGLADALDRALRPEPADRHPSLSALLRTLERGAGPRVSVVRAVPPNARDDEEERLKWAVGDDYEVLGFLGNGTFGSVWRVRDLSLEREVALKMLHPSVANDARAMARFRQEARLAARLAHPAIIPIFDLDGRGDVSWYTMELAEFGSIADLIARSGPRPFDELAQQIDSVLDALAAAHAHGIVHRDLKPENILIDRFRRWRITDFGIAKGEEEPAGTTGTPAFAAPEQLLGESQGPAADCFAAAAILAFALSGRPPFDGQNVQAILAQQLGGHFDYSQFPECLADFLRTGLNPDTSIRFADAAVMQAAWRQVCATMRREQTGQSPWWSWVLGR